MKWMKQWWLSGLLFILAMTAPAQAAENYAIDIKGQHAFIQFKIKHLGYSWLLGGFERFSGAFHYDAAHPENNSVHVAIDTASINTNHAERDKHLRSDEFFDVAHFPKATFTSSGYEDKGQGHGVLKGILNLHGVSKKVSIKVHQIGAGPDPWGGFRRGFEGVTTLYLPDYRFSRGKMLGPVAHNVEMYFSIEGVRQKAGQ